MKIKNPSQTCSPGARGPPRGGTGLADGGAGGPSVSKVFGGRGFYSRGRDPVGPRRLHPSRDCGRPGNRHPALHHLQPGPRAGCGRVSDLPGLRSHRCPVRYMYRPAMMHMEEMGGYVRQKTEEAGYQIQFQSGLNKGRPD
ncbi:hypothetical protein SAY87_005199 [Trapa incisa]|uniref:Uncharacterized protein n=1 Tax=Trapa incisa TaxID=236973 RepID=A0AAN7Q5X5_9MYRT|nr:hypothetical protein SAY87_005199 [Trapa incisa]